METYIKIKESGIILYRAGDSSGITLDIWLRKNRDKQAALCFLQTIDQAYLKKNS